MMVGTNSTPQNTRPRLSYGAKLLVLSCVVSFFLPSIVDSLLNRGGIERTDNDYAYWLMSSEASRHDMVEDHLRIYSEAASYATDKELLLAIEYCKREAQLRLDYGMATIQSDRTADAIVDGWMIGELISSVFSGNTESLDSERTIDALLSTGTNLVNTFSDWRTGIHDTIAAVDSKYQARISLLEDRSNINSYWVSLLIFIVLQYVGRRKKVTIAPILDGIEDYARSIIDSMSKS